MSSTAKVAVITGANKGIGYAIVRNLAYKYLSQPRSNPLIIYLSARNVSLGEAALGQIKQELSGKNILSGDGGGNVDIKFMKIDLTQKETIGEAAAVIEREHGGLDILINNAGMAFKGSTFNSNVVRTTFATNFHGTLEMCNKFFPLLRPKGRLINVSSTMGRTGILSADLKNAFTNPELDVVGLVALMENFQDAVDRGKWHEEGWPSNAYGMSKVGVTALSKVLARRVAAEGKDILVTSCCPGWIRTDMSPSAQKTPDQGAETPVFLALDENFVPNAENGQFWRDCQIQEW